MNRTRTLTVLLALLLVGVGPIFAADESDVSETQDPETLEVPPPDDIRLDSTSGTVTGSLQGKEGLRIQTLCTHCNSANIQIGGLAQEFAPISVDGYPVIGGLATSILLSIMPADTVAGAKVLKGPGRPIEPSTAAGGQILLEEATPQELPMIDVCAEAGEYDRRRATVRVAGDMASWVSGSLVVGDETASTVDDDNDGKNDVGTVDRTFAEGRLNFSIGRNHTIDVGASWIDEENIDGPGAYDILQPQPWTSEDSIFDREHYRAGWEWRFGDGHRLDVRASDSTRNLTLRSEVGVHFDMDEFADAKYSRFQVREDNEWAAIRYAHTINFGHRLEFGVDGRDQTVSADNVGPLDVFLDLAFDIPPPPPEPGTDSMRNWSAFVGYDWTPSPKWGLHAGVRHDDAEWEAEIFDTLSSTWSTRTRDDSRTVPRATLRYTPVSAWNFKLVAGGTFRAPRPILAEICCGQRYQRTVDTDSEMGESYGFEAVYQPSSSLRASLYLASTEFDDHILRMVGRSFLFVQTYVLGNISETRAETAELGLRWSPHRIVTLDGSIGWLSHHNTGDEMVFLPITDFGASCTDKGFAQGDCEQVGRPIDRVPYVPDRTGSISASVTLPHAISLTAQGGYTGSMLIQQFEDSSVTMGQNSLLPEMRSTDSFWLVNFSFEIPAGRQIEIVGGVDNLTDYLQDDLGDPTTDFNWGPLAGRSWRAGVRYSFR